MPPKSQKTKTATKDLEKKLAEAPQVSDTESPSSSSARERVLSALLVEALKKPKASSSQPTSVDAPSSNSKPTPSPRASLPQAEQGTHILIEQITAIMDQRFSHASAQNERFMESQHQMMHELNLRSEALVSKRLSSAEAKQTDWVLRLSSYALEHDDATSILRQLPALMDAKGPAAAVGHIRASLAEADVLTSALRAVLDEGYPEQERPRRGNQYSSSSSSSSSSATKRLYCSNHESYGNHATSQCWGVKRRHKSRSPPSRARDKYHKKG